MSVPSVFKRCGCRDRILVGVWETGSPVCDAEKGLGVGVSDHGTWHYRLELPPAADGASTAVGARLRHPLGRVGGT